MAPEQVRANGVVDARTDVWGLGATLYELVSGALPFDAGSVPAMLQRVLKDDPTPLRSVRADVPEALDAIVTRCLAKDPAARFASADELADALRAARSAMHAHVSQVLPRATVRLSSGPQPIARGDVPTADSPSRVMDRPLIPLPSERRRRKAARAKDRSGLVLGVLLGIACGAAATAVLAAVVARGRHPESTSLSPNPSPGTSASGATGPPRHRRR